MMHSAFDVGMHNKRLTLFTSSACTPYVAPEPTRANRSTLATADKTLSQTAAVQIVLPRMLCWRMCTLGCVLLSYVMLILSDYIGPPRTHGTKLNMIVMIGSPSLLLNMQLRGVRSHAAVAVLCAHLLVTLSFLADSHRFERETVCLTTLCALACILMTLAASHRPADMTACMLCMCAGAYLGALLILALLQLVDVLDTMTLLTLQQLYVFMTLLLGGLVRGPAHC